LEESNKSLQLLRDIAEQGEYIFDFVVQALHESWKFCMVILVRITRVVWKSHIIGGEVMIHQLEFRQF
jgi:hypothetical protein